MCEDGEWARYGLTTEPRPKDSECIVDEVEEEVEVDDEKAGLANPASVYCLDRGGELKMENTSGGVRGICILEDGTECEEWAYYRGECPGEEGEEGSEGMAEEAEEESDLELIKAALAART